MYRFLALLIVFASAAHSFAAPVSFSGVLTGRLGAGAGILDPLPPARQVIALLDFTDGAVLVSATGNVQVEGIGTFTVQPGLGAAITRTGDGNLNFNLVLGGGRSLNFTYSGQGASTTIDAAAMSALVGLSTGVSFVDSAAPGGSVSYSGTITAAPEPGTISLIALGASLFGGVVARRRLRAKAKQD